jgi:hypothetical protein
MRARASGSGRAALTITKADINDLADPDVKSLRQLDELTGA